MKKRKPAPRKKGQVRSKKQPSLHQTLGPEKFWAKLDPVRKPHPFARIEDL